ncbi:uncharacterized protein LOC103131014 isoform X1 [Poecilia formosa]|uniref:uncharacterized protein LOC103131014 isoform X1 n=1 Tax=Poecilia formosa TaxID=48698 RepID=UPI0004448FEF|nr:PREDICTED: uncharacterized protein LOC103131014 isoform X1 [Poecilia formosa]XP_007542614.1 PREDICTED: uncharacterized protein LOC103131014 isoform X1 [Poecilia formosa]
MDELPDRGDLNQLRGQLDSLITRLNSSLQNTAPQHSVSQDQNSNVNEYASLLQNSIHVLTRLSSALEVLQNSHNSGNPPAAAAIPPPPPPPSPPPLPAAGAAAPSVSAASASVKTPPFSPLLERERFNNVELRRPFRIPPACEDSVPDLASYYVEIMNHLVELADNAGSLARRNDVVQLELVGDNFSRHLNIHVSNDDDIQTALMDFLDELVQSNAELPSHGELEFILQIVRDPSGGVKGKAAKTLACELINKKRRHLYIAQNSDNKLCFAISLAHVYNNSFTDSEALQQVKQWQYEAGLTEQTPVTFTDVVKFENLLQRKIVEFYKNSKNPVLSKFETDFGDCTNAGLLLLHDQHYFGINNPKGFFGSKHFCQHCFSGYDNPSTHSCGGYCQICRKAPCIGKEYEPVYCNDCNRSCRNSLCYNKHKEPNFKPRAEIFASECETTKMCALCKRIYHVPITKQEKGHVCGTKCAICGEKIVPGSAIAVSDHLCYIQPLAKSDQLDDKIVFYDFESYFDQNGVHVPFLVCAKTLKGDTWFSYGLDCARKFILHYRKPMFKNYVFIAHNARAYDNYLLLSAMTELGISPHIMMTGSKIICFTEPDYKLKFIFIFHFLL